MFVVKDLVKEVGNILNRRVFDKRVPRREHQQSDLQIQEEWKKKSAQRIDKNQTRISRLRRRSLVNG